MLKPLKMNLYLELPKTATFYKGGFLDAKKMKKQSFLVFEE